MLKTKLYNQSGEVIGDIELDPKVFGVKVNNSLVHQVIVAQQANQRVVIADTKDRSEVRGGGRKPWRQKGTGRARAGTNRSPLWRSGGITFGPSKERNFSKKINKKMKRQALLMCLSDKLADKQVVVLDKLELPEAKTKLMSNILNKLPLKKKALIITPKSDEKIKRAVYNLPNKQIVSANNLNVLDVLSCQSLLLVKDSLNKIVETYK